LPGRDQLAVSHPDKQWSFMIPPTWLSSAAE